MITYDFLATLSEKFAIADFNLFIINLITAFIILVIGIFFGKFIKMILKKIIEKSGIERNTRKRFVNLLLNVIKWSIYILFISIAIDQLGIPQLTQGIASSLVVVPAIVGALLLVTIGFAIAVYLKGLVEDSKIEDAKVFSRILYYFILYIFLVFALKTALISQDKNAVNVIIIILTGVVATAVSFWHVKKS